MTDILAQNVANKLPPICQVLAHHLNLKKKKNNSLSHPISTENHLLEVCEKPPEKLKSYDCDQIPALSIISSIKPSQITITKNVTPPNESILAPTEAPR